MYNIVGSRLHANFVLEQIQNESFQDPITVVKERAFQFQRPSGTAVQFPTKD